MSETPTAEALAAAQEAADALVASTVADLIVLAEGSDLLVLHLAHAAETAKGDAARKGALAALDEAIAAATVKPEPDSGGDVAEIATTTDNAETVIEPAPDVAAAQEAADAPLELVSSGVPEGHFAMTNPDGGTSDQYETNAAGHILVPYEEAPIMASHGFVVVGG